MSQIPCLKKNKVTVKCTWTLHICSGFIYIVLHVNPVYIIGISINYGWVVKNMEGRVELLSMCVWCVCSERSRPNFVLVKDNRLSSPKAQKVMFSVTHLGMKLYLSPFSLCLYFTLWLSLSLFLALGELASWQHHTEKKKLKSQSVCEMFLCVCISLFVWLPFSLLPSFSASPRTPPLLYLPPIPISPTFFWEDSRKVCCFKTFMPFKPVLVF